MPKEASFTCLCYSLFECTFRDVIRYFWEICEESHRCFDTLLGFLIGIKCSRLVGFREIQVQLCHCLGCYLSNRISSINQISFIYACSWHWSCNEGNRFKNCVDLKWTSTLFQDFQDIYSLGGFGWGFGFVCNGFLGFSLLGSLVGSVSMFTSSCTAALSSSSASSANSSFVKKMALTNRFSF